MRAPFRASFRPLLLLVLLLGFLAPPGSARLGLLAGVGASHPSPSEAHLAFTGGLFYAFDQQTLLGIQSGRQILRGEEMVPLLGSVYLRLPLGRIVMPVATGDWGYAYGDERAAGFLWRAGGGFDIRNGRRSSILLLAGYEERGFYSDVYTRAGLLLEL